MEGYWFREMSSQEKQAHPMRAFKQALVLLDLGYIECGLYLLKQLESIGQFPIQPIFDYYAAWRKDPRPLWKKLIPNSIKIAAKRMLRKISGQI